MNTNNDVLLQLYGLEFDIAHDFYNRTLNIIDFLKIYKNQDVYLKEFYHVSILVKKFVKKYLMVQPNESLFRRIQQKNYRILENSANNCNEGRYLDIAEIIRNIMNQLDQFISH